MGFVRKHQKSIIIGSILIIIGCFLALLWPVYYQHQCETRVWPDLEKKVETVRPAVIGIVDITRTEDTTSYGAGASGVLFMQKGARWYALTAAHVVAAGAADPDGSAGKDALDAASVEYRAFTVRTPTMGEYQKAAGGEHRSQESYYRLYPKLRIEAVDREADLAVVSFRSEDPLATVSLSSETPAKGERIVVIGNPDGQRFRTTYGLIRSDGPYKFDPGDGIVNDVIKHNAYEAPGSSGSPAFDENMELAGINIGGGRNFFGCFRYGVMIPADQIREFLDE